VHSATAIFTERIKPHLLPALLLVGLTFAVYVKVLGHDFLLNWDDPNYVTNNEAIRGFSVEHLKMAMTRLFYGNYAPLHILSYMSDYAVWGGLRPAGFFFTNILLHALNGLFLYALLAKVTGRKLWGFAAAFIFVCHPVQVESVAWISERKNLLAMFFFLPSLYLYILYRERGWETGKTAYALSLLAFLLSLMAKSAAVILPPVLLLYDICYGERKKPAELLPDKIPYLFAAGIFSVLAFLSHGADLPDGGGRTTYHGGSPLATLFTMLPVFARYLALLFWPAHLSAAYDPPIKTGIDLSVALAALLLSLLAVFGVYLYRRRRDLLFWYSLFFIGLLPVSQIVPIITLMNDRYLYFPLLGAAACFGALFPWLDSRGGWRRVAGMGVAILSLLTLPFVSFARTDAWRDSMTLWNDAVAKSPGATMAWIGLGDALIDQEKYDEALTAMSRAYALEPHKFATRKTLGFLYSRVGRPDEGRTLLLELVREFPAAEEAYLKLGDNYFSAGDLSGAEQAYRQALTVATKPAEALIGLGNISRKRGNVSEANRFRQMALAADPLNPFTLNKLGALYTMEGNYAAGRSLLIRLVSDNPRSLAGFINLGGNYYMTGELASAEQAYRSALAINPGSAKALGYLGTVYLRMGKLEAAREMFTKALTAGGNRGELEYDLACTESLSGRPGPALEHLMTAVANGFRDYRRIAGNRELAQLRETAEFRQITMQSAK
jgi:tetratricopeptide (TPR) repeat protein